MSAYDDIPSDCEPTNVTPLPRRKGAKLLVFGSFVRDALANQAQNDLAVELAKLERISSADAGQYDDKGEA